jgi:uncharacterized membrane protein
MPSSFRRRRPVGAFLLLLSLGLNVFLLGWAATQYFAPSSCSKPDPAPEVVGESIAEALPAPDAALLRRALAEKQDALHQAREQYLAAVGRLRETLIADPFDSDAYQDAVTEVHASRQAERTLFGSTLAGVIPQMSHEGRKAFVASRLRG